MITVNAYKYGPVKTLLGELPCAFDGDSRAQFFPLRMACRLLGIKEDRQVEIAKEQYPDALRTIHIELDVGWRPMLCMRRKELALWIAGIDPKRCKLETQSRLLAFRDELLAAADRLFFQSGDTANIGSAIATGQPKPVTSVEIRAIGLCPCCNKPTNVLIEDGVTVLSHVDDLEAL